MIQPKVIREGVFILMMLTEVPRENHQPSASHWQTYNIMLYQVHLAWAGFELRTLVAIGTDCIGSCKSNYHSTNHMNKSGMCIGWSWFYQLITSDWVFSDVWEPYCILAAEFNLIPIFVDKRYYWCRKWSSYKQCQRYSHRTVISWETTCLDRPHLST